MPRTAVSMSFQDDLCIASPMYRRNLRRQGQVSSSECCTRIVCPQTALRRKDKTLADHIARRRNASASSWRDLQQ